MKIVILVFACLMLVGAQEKSAEITIDGTAGTNIRLGSFEKDSGSLEVKELSEKEIEALGAARQKHAAALLELKEMEDKIRAKYGQDQPTWTITTGCMHNWTNVELRGKYALITKGSTYSCGGAFLGRVR